VSRDGPIDFIMFKGYGQAEDDPDYDPLTRRLTAIGYEPLYQPITWFGPPPDRTPTLWADWLEQCRPICALPYPGRRRIYAGFSIGALVALTMAARYPPDELWLLSPSVWVPEASDINGVSEMMARSQTTSAVRESLSVVNVASLAQAITCPVNVAVGRKDGAPLQEWATRIARLLTARRYYRIRGAGHDPLGDAYLNVIAGRMAAGHRVES
jgi:pimeloyl-ACP methyl ester carboxylesterase